MQRLQKNAIVTGAASGLGRAMAIRLAREGWNLALADVDESGSQATLAMVESAGGSGQIEQLDVSQPEQWQDLGGRLRDQWQYLDLLVNNAGVCGAGEVGEFTLADWRWLLDINLHGVIYGCHTMTPWLKENPGGSHIINTASIAGFLSVPSMSAYNLSKAGVISLSETLSAELGPHGVGVSVLCPGFVATSLLETGRFYDRAQKSAADGLMASARLKPEDIAEAAVRAMHKKKLYVIPDLKSRIFWRWKRWLPAMFLKITASQSRQVIAAEEASYQETEPAIPEEESHTVSP